MESSTRVFRDRAEGGRLLAERLSSYANRSDVIVVALLRGGVPVGYEISKRLNLPLDVLTVRKLGVPGQPELAMGAITSGGIRVLNEDLLSYLFIPEEEIEAVTERERKELERRERVYRGDRPLPDMSGLTMILVDDGIATGSTMRAAVEALKKQHAARIVIAVPVAAESTCDEFNSRDEIVSCVCLETPQSFFAVGLWYEDFPQLTDEEVREMLDRLWNRPASNTIKNNKVREAV
jgi:putative phosphoribosyl transferase